MRPSLDLVIRQVCLQLIWLSLRASESSISSSLAGSSSIFSSVKDSSLDYACSNSSSTGTAVPKVLSSFRRECRILTNSSLMFQEVGRQPTGTTRSKYTNVFRRHLSIVSSSAMDKSKLSRKTGLIQFWATPLFSVPRELTYYKESTVTTLNAFIPQFQTKQEMRLSII